MLWQFGNTAVAPHMHALHLPTPRALFFLYFLCCDFASSRPFMHSLRELKQQLRIRPPPAPAPRGQKKDKRRTRGGQEEDNSRTREGQEEDKTRPQSPATERGHRARPQSSGARPVNVASSVSGTRGQGRGQSAWPFFYRIEPQQ